MTPSIRRISRRALLTDLGAAGVGLVILGACGGADGDSSPTSDSDRTDPARTTGSETGSTAEVSPSAESPTTESPSTESPSTGPNGSVLRLQHVPLGFVSAFVLVRGDEAAIVDTGTEGSRADIFAGLDALGVGPSNVRHVVLTHNHGDHIGGLAGMEDDLTAATVWGGADDITAVRTSLALRELADGDEVFGMGVIATPGHTPGSISLFDTETGLLVAGDAVTGDGSGGLAGANPDFTPDMDTAGRSLDRLAALRPSIVAFGHGGAPVADDAAAKLAAVADGS